VKLYLARHGESFSVESDPLQSLSPQGIIETKTVAQLLKSLELEIDEILHSPKLRARQTAEILGNIIAPELTLIQLEALTPTLPIEPVIEEISAFDRDVLLVGHLPFMEKILTKLLTGQEGFSPVDFCASCIVCLERKQATWKISWVVSPALCDSRLIQKEA
jgi:phosphohistidine phosphatase